MSKLWDVLPNQLSKLALSPIEFENDPFWGDYQYQGIGVTIHLAILAKKYLELILTRNKTIESRFSMHRRIPYKRIERGDVILFKETGGPIRGLGYVSNVDFFQLINGMTFDKIKEQYSTGLQIQDESYWEKYARSCYGTLIHLDHVKRVDPLPFSKKDRNAWVIFDPIA